MPVLLTALVVALLGWSPCPRPVAGSTAPPPGEPVAPAARDLVACVSGALDTHRWDEADDRLAVAGPTDGMARPDALLWRATVTRLRAARLVQERDWTSLQDTPASEWEDVLWVKDLLTGLAAARLAWAAQDAERFVRASEAARRLTELGRRTDDPEIRRASMLVQAAVAGGQYERDEMALLLDEASRIEQQLTRAMEGLFVPMILARELEADLLLQTDRYAQAAERYREVLESSPRRVHSWHGFAAAARRLGRVSEAADADAVAARLLSEP